MSGDSRLVTVRSADHHNTLVSGLWEFYQGHHGVDLFLQSGTQLFSAHQLVVDIFLPKGVTDLASSHLDTSLGSLLKFLYTGQVTVHHEQLADLHAIARDFDFGMLVDAIQLANTLDEAPLAVDGKCQSNNLEPNKDPPILSKGSDDEERAESIRTKAKAVVTKQSKLIMLPSSGGPTTYNANGVGPQEVEESVPAVAKKRPGRPRKNRAVVMKLPSKKGVGRPRKVVASSPVEVQKANEWVHQTGEKKQIDFQSHNEGVFEALDGKMSTRSRTRSSVRRTYCDADGSPVADQPRPKSNKKLNAATKLTKPLHSRRKQWRLPMDICEPMVHEPTPPPEAPKEKVFKCGHCNFTGTVMERVAEHIRTEHVRTKVASAEGGSIVDPSGAESPDMATISKMGEAVGNQINEDENALPSVAEGGSNPEQKSLKDEKEDTEADANDMAPSLRCPDCVFATTNESEYRVHLVSHDPSVAYFQCHTCLIPFADAASFRRHDEAVHGDCSSAPPAVLRCPRCGYRPVSSAPGKLDKYMAHLTSAHRIDDRGQLGARLCKCARCDFTCVNVDDMAQHDRTVHRNKICHCPRCEFTCVNTADMKAHVQGHRYTDPVRCKKCEHTAAGRAALKVHYRRVHPPLATRLCSVCGYRAKSDNRLRDHTRKHSGEKPFICEICGRGFGELGTLRRHVKEVHAQHKRSFPCDRCGQTYLRVTTLAIHKKQCGLQKQSDTPGQMPRSSRHLKKTGNPGRTKPKPTNCRLCPYVSQSLGAMVKHVNEKHPGECGFACDQCNYTCKDPTGLNRHQLRHTGGKPFKCRVCDRSFRDGATCKRHQRLHGSRRPLNCPMCHKKFDWPDYLRTHLKTVHKITDPATLQPVAVADPEILENEVVVDESCAIEQQVNEQQINEQLTEDNTLGTDVVHVDGSTLSEEYVEFVPGQSIILQVINYPEL